VSHKSCSDNYGISVALPGYCRACGNRSVRGKRGFCSDACRFWSYVQKGPDCWLWTGARHKATGKDGTVKDSYGQVYYKGRPRRAHIVSWAISVGHLPDVSIGGFGICHKCDNPICVRPSHLFVGTHRENMQDAARKGRLSIARPGRQKVSPADINEMRRFHTAGQTHKAIAAYFGIARSTVSEIISGKRRRYDAPLVPQQIEKAS
jgi:hypothetical protein